MKFTQLFVYCSLNYCRNHVVQFKTMIQLFRLKIHDIFMNLSRILKNDHKIFRFVVEFCIKNEYTAKPGYTSLINKLSFNLSKF